LAANAVSTSNVDCVLAMQSIAMEIAIWTFARVTEGEKIHKVPVQHCGHLIADLDPLPSLPMIDWTHSLL
jgi:hypothetical protein